MTAATIDGALGVEVNRALRTYIEETVPFLTVGHDPDNFTRSYCHNPPLLVELHKQMASYMSELCGEALKPSYAFLSMYEIGGVCPLHIDRPQCYRTLDYLIRQDQTAPWPLYIGPVMSDADRWQATEQGFDDPSTVADIKARTNFTTVLLEPGDAVAYSGTHQWHYRDRLPSGTADLAFFHFVPEGFRGGLN